VVIVNPHEEAAPQIIAHFHIAKVHNQCVRL